MRFAALLLLGSPLAAGFSRRAPVRMAATTQSALDMDESIFQVSRVRTLFEKAAAVKPTDLAAHRPELCNPIVVVPDFLSAEECDAFIAAGKLRQNEGIISEAYLNHRVNQELESGGSSEEAAELIGDQSLSEDQLGADCPSGTRTPLPHTLLLEPHLGTAAARPTAALLQTYDAQTEAERETVVSTAEGSIGRRVLDLLGIGREQIQFADQLWLSPNPNKVMFRDQTIVHYKAGEGVAPHVDGQDVTILIYLNDVAEGAGGRTVFPEAGIAVPPRRGTAVFYCSRKDKLLHYAERVAPGHEKWVSQMLIDYRFRASPTGN
mmetsp:Transcript_24984/g.78254  ORF Transcript_24984/g.78254 Transcript_24984/m.78254 type:complete len:321 (-) Transcript_24984:92-1054(-)|eukprot:CAMPEP_0118885860 /NCGR_PEP_ID=MMETSP1163-20130328/24159_1 /TAXON_ID=124430 /ORGANISM="Phaeomonas parva, Strain CCMP2877" /LENGTH=320 /DNA_ID=CAMNT_0006823939 /DNA_START=79 /DNA_END=1041 /DNA_ORIENTATION=+